MTKRDAGMPERPRPLGSDYDGPGASRSARASLIASPRLVAVAAQHGSGVAGWLAGTAAVDAAVPREGRMVSSIKYMRIGEVRIL